VEHGAPNGQFILRNAYGKRILRVSYFPDSRWAVGPSARVSRRP
jgi:hypothetical protein